MPGIGIRPAAVVLGVLDAPLNCARCQPALARLAIRSQSPFPKIKDEGCGTPMHDWAPAQAPRACLMHWSWREIYLSPTLGRHLVCEILTNLRCDLPVRHLVSSLDRAESSGKFALPESLF